MSASCWLIRSAGRCREDFPRRRIGSVSFAAHVCGSGTKKGEYSTKEGVTRACVALQAVSEVPPSPSAGH